MELEQARKRAEELRVIIEKNNRLYYDQDAPELEDFEYDALNRELKQIEAEYPELVTASSPTQHVGGTASSKFSKVTHAVKMESLQDAPRRRAGAERICQGAPRRPAGKPAGRVFL